MYLGLSIFCTTCWKGVSEILLSLFEFTQKKVLQCQTIPNARKFSWCFIAK